MAAPKSRRILRPSLGELIDRLTIDQIKEVAARKDRADYVREMADIQADLDQIFKERKIRPNAKFLRLVIALGQVNLHIWNTKDQMIRDKSRFKQFMKLAHQLNGVRNQIKNNLSVYEKNGSGRTHGNIRTEDLAGWTISALKDRE